MIRANISPKSRYLHFDKSSTEKDNSLQHDTHYNNWKKSKQPKTILRFLQNAYLKKMRNLKMDNNQVFFLTIPSIKGFTINYSPPTDANHHFLFEWLKEVCLEKLAIEQCSYSHVNDFPEDKTHYRERYSLQASKTAKFAGILVQIEYKNNRIHSLKFSANNPASKPVNLSDIFVRLLS